MATANGRSKRERFQDLTGQTFGRLTVVSDAGKRPNSRHRWWLCRCECGQSTIVPANSLRSENTRSCGCLFVERKARRNGQSLTPELQSWRSMISRCTRPKHRSYPEYGGRGIAVCDRWLGPDGHANFLRDMGPKPSRHHTIDRIDSNGNYEPGNCRWATFAEQARNKRNNVFLTHDGRTMCVKDWAREVDVDPGQIMWRIRHGWTVEAALTKLPRNRGYNAG